MPGARHRFWTACAAATVAALTSAVSCPAAGQSATPESRPPSHAHTQDRAADAEPTLLDRVRTAYLAAPTTERIRVSVRIGELPPRRSLLLVRLEPAPDAQSISRAVIRAGRLLIEAEPGRVRAMLDSPDSPVFEAATAPAGIAGALAEVFPPLPLAMLDFAAVAEGEGGEVGGTAPPASLTPYGAAAEFDSPDLRQRSGNAVLTGRIRGGTFRLTVDAASGRIHRLELAIGDPADPSRLRTITIEHAPSSAYLTAAGLADPARKRVNTLAMLIAGEPAAAVGTRFNAATGSSGEAALRAALRDVRGEPRFAIVLLGGLPAPGRTRPDAATTLATVIALRAEFAAFNAGNMSPEGAPHSSRAAEPGFAVLWHGADADEDAALERLAQSGGERVHTAGIAGAESELARIAPNSAAAFIILAPDQTILAVHPLEALPAGPEQQIAGLLMSFLDAAARYETDPKEGP